MRARFKGLSCVTVFCVASDLDADVGDQGRCQCEVHLVQRTNVAPLVEIAPHCGTRREALRQFPPWDAAGCHIKYCVQHLAHIGDAGGGRRDALALQKEPQRPIPHWSIRLDSVEIPMLNYVDSWISQAMASGFLEETTHYWFETQLWIDQVPGLRQRIKEFIKN
jgi:hypothetical protein